MAPASPAAASSPRCPSCMAWWLIVIAIDLENLLSFSLSGLRADPSGDPVLMSCSLALTCVFFRTHVRGGQDFLLPSNNVWFSPKPRWALKSPCSLENTCGSRWFPHKKMYYVCLDASCVFFKFCFPSCYKERKIYGALPSSHPSYEILHLIRHNLP
jgi:hypothetical protein